MSQWLHRHNPYLEPRQPLWLPTLWGDLELVTPASGTIIQVSDVHSQSRIDSDITDDDGLIANLIVAAQSMIELALPGNRQLLTATYNLPMMGWWRGPMRLPRPPLQAVNSISYYDSYGNFTVLDPGTYLVRTPWRQPGRVERAPFMWWPALQCDRRLTVAINFTAGYAGTTVAVPISAGTQTVTPASMAGINVGTALAVDAQPNLERVVVTAVTGTTFTATFTKSHSAGVWMDAVPQTLKQAALMLVAYWYVNRETALTQVPKEIEFAFNALLEVESWGSYA